MTRRSVSVVLGRRALAGPALVSALATAGTLVASPAGFRLVMALAAGLLLVVFALRSPRVVLSVLVVWFVFLGLVRRLVLTVSPTESYGDPLILVGAATWVVLAGLAVRRGALANRGLLTRAVLILLVLLAASALNPLQGGITVGFGGALLVVVPMTSFFVGRSLVDDELLRRLLALVGWFGLLVAAYGLYQTFVGFPWWDEQWIAQHGNDALNVGGVVRAFASFSAASEYASFLGIAIVVWVSRSRSLARTSFGLGALGLLASAMWYESARGIIVLTVVGVGAVVSARAGLTLGRSLLLGAAVLLVLPLLISRLAPSTFSDDAGGRLAQHQVAGLSDPFGEGSTLPLHIDSLVGGLTSAIADPLGVGVGSVTISGEKYGGTVRPTEADPSNVAVAAGFPGFLSYLVVLILAMPRAYRHAVRRRDPLSLASLGIVVVTSLQWLNGGHYATAFWPWLILGWTDARPNGVDSAPDSPGADAREISA